MTPAAPSPRHRNLPAAAVAPGPGRGSGCAIGLPCGHFLGNRRAVDDGYRTTVHRRATLDQNHCCYNSYPLLIHFLTSSQKSTECTSAAPSLQPATHPIRMTDSAGAAHAAARPRRRFAAANIGHLHSIRAAFVVPSPLRASTGVGDIVGTGICNGSGSARRMKSVHTCSAPVAPVRRLAVVVAPQPDHCQKILAEAGEPAVTRIVGGAGLAARLRATAAVGCTPSAQCPRAWRAAWRTG